MRKAILLIFFLLMLLFFSKFHLLNLNKLPYKIYVSNGDGLFKIGNSLYDDNVIKSRLFFKLYSIFLIKIGYISDVKYGEYIIDSPKLINFFKKLKNEDTITYQITFPEGITAKEFVNIINSNEILIGDRVEFSHEGYLMPETYFFKKGDSRQFILENANQAMFDFLKQNEGIIKNSEVRNQDDLIKLASIVEKETAIESEKPIVAKVYLNRLKIGMKLQADPTTIYAITKGERNFGRTLTYKDLKIKDLYNTYQYKGLPIKPIGNPSKSTILACLNPARHNYIYFVANGDGSHNFSVTYKGHLLNVANYRKKQNESK